MDNGQSSIIRDLAAAFTRIFRLGNVTPMHDGVHAMTGFWSTIGDEVRVCVYEKGLNGIVAPDVAISDARVLYDHLMLNMHRQNNGASTPARRAEMATPMISAEEFTAHFNHARAVGREVVRLTGTAYDELSLEQVNALDISAFGDVMGRAWEIKRAHMTPVTREIEEIFARDLFNAAATHGNPAPAIAAGAPWRGALAL